MTDGIAVLSFGGVVVMIEAAVMIIRKRGWGPQSIRIVGLTVIIISTIFLAVSTVSAERLSAAYAVLGVVAGYLVGHSDKQKGPISRSGQSADD